MPFPRKLLTEGEEIMLDLQPHWIALARPALVTLAALAALMLILVKDLTGWLALAVAAVWLVLAVVPFLQWRFTMFVLTNERVISRGGIIAKHSKEIPLETINDVTFNQSILERMVGAGDLVIESAGESGQEPFTNIRRPEHVQLEIYRASEARKGLASRAPASPMPAAPGTSVADELAKLADLRDRGAITPEEFEAQKRKLLG